MVDSVSDYSIDENRTNLQVPFASADILLNDIVFCLWIIS